ncbi:MAG TPA: MlaD family protein, partial [Acetobacteraceae bacterium]|nr:MlaD family protein [Acetobacteraceae bacterium]
YQYVETSVEGPVSGLATGAIVRLNGIDVGRVVRIDLDADDPKLVTLLLEVRSTVTVHSDAVASIESQGLTGVSYVEISGGTRGAPPVAALADRRYPRIASRPSSLQQVFNNAPELVGRLIIIGDRLESLLDDDNRAAIAQTLGNLRDTTGVLAHRSKDIDQLMTDSGAVMHNLVAASASLKTMAANFERASDKSDQLIASAREAFDHATKLASDIDTVVQASRPGLRQLTTNSVAQVDELLTETRRLVASLNRVSTGLERDPSRLLLGDKREGYQPR